MVESGKNPRSAKIIQAEEAVRKNGGACLVSGRALLTGQRRSLLDDEICWKRIASRSDRLTNLLHYEDAATNVSAALSAGSLPAVLEGSFDQ